MKYRIVVERSENGLYTAYSPVADSLRARGESIGEVLDNLQKKMLCFLHDPQIELDIIVELRGGTVLDFSGNSVRQIK
ncbi:MAG: hypothetical protein ABII64_07345 [Elusimicrobiota bacterium]